LQLPTYSQRFHAQGLTGVRNGHCLFENIAFSLAPGAALLVTGPNGAGKSTLLRILAGLLPPAAGRSMLIRDGSTADDGVQDEADSGLRLVYVGHANAIKAGLSVAQNVRFWAELAGGGAAERRDRGEAALAAFDLTDLADLPARYLSAGQKRRLALSRLVAMPAALWLLDEPSTALDAGSVALLEAAVGAHRTGGGIAVIATHQDLSVPGAERLVLGGQG
jgi:heme exporter protein A